MNANSPIKRVNVSLRFSDNDLFEGFIRNLRDNRELASVIEKCLTAYYYDTTVRNATDSFSGVPQDALIENEGEKKENNNQEICDNIRSLLAAQSFLADSLQNTVEDGLDDLGTILNDVNDVATKSGFAEEKETDTGNVVLRITDKAKNPDAIKESLAQKAEKSENESASVHSGDMSVIFKVLTRMAQKIGDSDALQMLGVTEEVADVEEEVVKPKARKKAKPVKEEVVEQPKVEEKVELAAPPTVEEEEPIEATDELKSLFDSILM